MPSPFKKYPIQTCVRMTKRQFKGLKDWAKLKHVNPSQLIRDQIDQHITNSTVEGETDTCNTFIANSPNTDL